MSAEFIYIGNCSATPITTAKKPIQKAPLLLKMIFSLERIVLFIYLSVSLTSPLKRIGNNYDFLHFLSTLYYQQGLTGYKHAYQDLYLPYWCII
jgi:hypothetical protein